jgi:site-specific recombinase XerD
MNNLVAPWGRRFLVKYVIGERNYSPNTQHRHRDTLRLFLPLVAQRCRCAVDRSTFAHIKPPVVREFIRHLEQVRHCGPATLNQRLVSLHSWHVLSGATARNIWIGVASFTRSISKSTLLLPCTTWRKRK